MKVEENYLVTEEENEYIYIGDCPNLECSNIYQFEEKAGVDYNIDDFCQNLIEVGYTSFTLYSGVTNVGLYGPLVIVKDCDVVWKLGDPDYVQDDETDDNDAEDDKGDKDDAFVCSQEYYDYCVDNSKAN